MQILTNTNFSNNNQFLNHINSNKNSSINNIIDLTSKQQPSKIDTNKSNKAEKFNKNLNNQVTKIPAQLKATIPAINEEWLNNFVNYHNKVSTQYSFRPGTTNEIKKRLNMNILAEKDNVSKNIRFTRPNSTYKDKVFNKFWSDETDFNANSGSNNNNKITNSNMSVSNKNNISNVSNINNINNNTNNIHNSFVVNTFSINNTENNIVNVNTQNNNYNKNNNNNNNENFKNFFDDQFLESEGNINNNLNSNMKNNQIKDSRLNSASLYNKYSNNKTRAVSAMSNISKTTKEFTFKDKLPGLNKQLYVFDQYNWDSKKDFNFLSNIGGIDIENCSFLYKGRDDSMTTDITGGISRPTTGLMKQMNLDINYNNVLENSNLNNVRPFTGGLRMNQIINKHNLNLNNINNNINNVNSNDVRSNAKTIDSQINTDIYNKNNLDILDKKIITKAKERPITAINRPNSSIKAKYALKPLSGIKKGLNNKNEIYDLVGEIDEILEDSHSILELDNSKDNKQIKECINNNNTNNNNAMPHKTDGFNRTGQISYRSIIDKNTQSEKRASKAKVNFNINNDNQNNTNSKNSLSPHVDKLKTRYQNIDVVNYSIKLQTADTDYLDIFDRSQRTRAATITKVGDYDYYTPCQRIGLFIEFSQHLKYEDVKNIEKHVSFQKNQLTFMISKKSHLVLDFTEDPNDTTNNQTKNYFKYATSLFHGFMTYEADIESYYLNIGVKNQTFDPTKFIHDPISQDIFNINTYPPDLKKAFLTSINNYNKYLDSDKIKFSDLEPFDITVRKRVLMRINSSFFTKYQDYFKLFFYEIEKQYYLTLKNIIMQYVIRSPYERMRLNIQYFPKKILPTSSTIASHGGFNRLLYHKWVTNYHNSKTFISENFSTLGIFGTSIYDWTYNFEHIELFMYDFTQIIEDNTRTVSIHDFIGNQNKYLNKSFRFLKDIYYRGVNFIIKLNKKFVKKGDPHYGKWTFKGYLQNPKYKTNYYNTFFPNSTKSKKSKNNKNISVLKSNRPYSSNINANTNNNNNIENDNYINRTDRTKTYLSSNYQEEERLATNIEYLERRVKKLQAVNLVDPATLNFFLRTKQTKLMHNLLNNNTDISSPFYNPFFEMGLFDDLIDFCSNALPNDFQDIRINPSYFAYESILMNRVIDLESNIVETLFNKQQKERLNNSVVSYVQIFFRKILEKSLTNFVNYILSFKHIEDIVKTVTYTSMSDSNNNNINIDYNNNENYNEDPEYKGEIADTITKKESKNVMSSINNNNYIEIKNTQYTKTSKKITNIPNNHEANINNAYDANKKGTDKNILKFNLKATSQSQEYDINSEIHYYEKEIRLPKIKALSMNDKLNPIISLKITWETSNGSVRFEMQFEEIVSLFVDIIDKSLSVFNTIVSPHHLEFEIITQSEYEKAQKDHWSKLNQIFSDPTLKSHSDDYFNNYCPNIYLKEESVPSYMKSYLKISDKTEELFTSMKAKIGKSIKRHYIEMEESLLIFEPIKELINGQLSDNIVTYVSIQKAENKKDYNKIKFFLERIRIFIRYVTTIPRFIDYSLMSVDFREIKTQLLEKLNNSLNVLMSSLEEEIITLYNNCIDRYNHIHKLIDKKLNTPEDVVNMEQTKLGLVNENSIIYKDYDEAFRVFAFLMQVDHIFTDDAMFKVIEMMRRHSKFKKDYEE